MFKSSITFNYVWNLYQFDRELRLLVSDAIEKIEVAFRASISDVTSGEYGLFCYTDNKFYRNPSQHLSLMRKIDGLLKKPEEVFLQHYLEQYNDPKYPPIWMIIEALSFGTCSKLFSNIQSIATRNKISGIFEQHTTIIESWMKVIVWIKNICAHHARLWNRWLVDAPIIPKNDPLHGYLLNGNRKFIVCAYLLITLLKTIAPNNHWKNNLFNLFKKYSKYSGVTTGFMNEWRNDPLLGNIMSLRYPILSPMIDSLENQSSIANVDIFLKNDLIFSINFLKQYNGNKETFKAYRREIEPILQWSWLIVKKSIFDLKRQDIQDYIEFCLAPPKFWIGKKHVPRFIEQAGARNANPKWRPFVATINKRSFKSGEKPDKSTYQLSQKSIREIFTILNSFYSYLALEEKVAITQYLLLSKKANIYKKDKQKPLLCD